MRLNGHMSVQHKYQQLELYEGFIIANFKCILFI